MKRGFFYYFGMVMAAVYIAAGTYIIGWGDNLQIVSQRPLAFKYVLGALLIAYGVYRLAKQQLQQRNNDYNDQILDDDNES